jgi:hypothetical protein
MLGSIEGEDHKVNGDDWVYKSERERGGGGEVGGREEKRTVR